MTTGLKKLSACPGWLNVSDDRRSFILTPENADVVRKIFDLSINGLGSYSIAKQFDRQGVRTFGSSPKWDHSNIDNILRNRATVGEHQPKSYAGGSKKGVPVGEPVPNYYPAAIDEETFQAAQEARQRHLRSGRGRKGNNLANLFTGITSCAYCGALVKFHSNKHLKSLICSQVLEEGSCIRAGWSYANFEQSVLYFLSHPALKESAVHEIDGIKRLIDAMRRSPISTLVDVRFELAAKLRRAVVSLKLANMGESPKPPHAEALIRRDHPERLFEIQFANGAIYKGAAL